MYKYTRATVDIIIESIIIKQRDTIYFIRGVQMGHLKFILPAEEHKDRAAAFKQEFFDNGETVIHGSGLLDQLDYTSWLAHTTKYRLETTAGDDWVPSTTFFVVHTDTQSMVGIVDIRHHIRHPFLAEYGGHIGYAVRPSERRRGYAAEMLSLALVYAKSLGLERVMLSCYADNIGSIKTIKKNNGVLTEEKNYPDGRPMHVYWIDLAG